MDFKIVKTIEEFEPLKIDWERIEKLSPISTYHSTFYYNFLWWKAFKKSGQKELFIIVIYNNNRAIGIAPLKIEKKESRTYNYEELNFLAPGDYCNFLIDIESGVEKMKILDEVFKVIDDNKNKYDKINLTHISQHAILSHYLLTRSRNKDFRYLIENPYIDFSIFDTYEQFTNTFLPKKIKQYQNRFKREVNYKVIVTDENVIDKISKTHIAEKDFLHTKGKVQRHSSFENENEYTFTNALYSNNSNVLTYMLVDVDKNEELICFYTGYVYKNIFHSGITAYNPNYQRLAVGKIFNYMIFEINMKQPRWKIFDMGTGRYPWKFEMTDTFNLLYQYSVFQPLTKKVYYIDKFEKLIMAILKFLRK